MNLSTLTTNGNYIGTALNTVSTGTCVRHDVRGNIGIEPTDFATKSIRLVGDIGATIGDRNGGSSMSCEKPGALFTIARGRLSSIEHIRLTGRADQTGVRWTGGKCSALIGDSFENFGVGVDVACNGFALLACEIHRDIFVECKTGIRVYAGDGGTGLPSAQTNNSTGLAINSVDITGGDYGIDIVTSPWRTTIANTSVQAQKKAGIIIRGGNVTLQGVYVETLKTVGPPTLIIPSLVVLGSAKVTLIDCQLSSWFFEHPENVTILGSTVNLRSQYVLTMDHLRAVGTI